ncbi:MAG: helix-turn-helix domain-containing protein [Firmicutes bacterium]|nr:helix-turn-helix domain-containing protein [Bacillota bacterium]
MLQSYASDNTFKMNQPFFKDNVFDYHEVHIDKPYQAVFYEFITSYSCASGISCVPSGCLDIMFVTEIDEPFMMFVGSPTEIKTVRGCPNSRYFGVRLKPGMNLAYQSHPLRDLTNNEIVLNSGNAPVKSFFGKLKKTHNLEQRILLFNQSFDPSVETGSSAELTQQMLVDINRTRGGIHIAELAEKLNYSERHLSRIFQDTMGMSPKTFARIVRFQNVIEIILSSAPQHMSDYFIDLGYSDQAHFQREFKQYSGMTPKSFIQYMQHG